MKIHRLPGAMMALALALLSFFPAGAAPSVRPTLLNLTYFVSPTGRDTNSGTQSSPFKTFAKALSVMGAGDTLTILPGTYAQQLKIAKSGTSSAGITVNGSGAIIDLLNSTAPGILVTGSYVSVSGLEVKNIPGVCVDLRGSNVAVSGLTVHECQSHGISTANNSHVRILNSSIFRAVLSNSARTMTSGWGSGLKVRVSDDVLIQGNVISNNYGEGMATRATNITMRDNTVFDNYSVNIYTNSENATIERNFVYCTPNSGFERSGKPAAGIALGEEYYAGWGARLKNARVLNNIVTRCKNGMRYLGAEAGVEGGGLKYATIAYNTFYDTVETAFAVVYEPAQAGNMIADNIVWQKDNKLVSVSGSGLAFKNNLWKVLPPVIARGPGDRTGNPSFVLSIPGNTAPDYHLAGNSLARGGAADLSIAMDYFGLLRYSPFDMGAAQYDPNFTP